MPKKLKQIVIEDELETFIKEEIDRMVEEGFLDRLRARGAGVGASAKAGLGNVGKIARNVGRAFKGDPEGFEKKDDPKLAALRAKSESRLKRAQAVLEKVQQSLTVDFNKLDLADEQIYSVRNAFETLKKRLTAAISRAAAHDEPSLGAGQMSDVGSSPRRAVKPRGKFQSVKPAAMAAEGKEKCESCEQQVKAKNETNQ